MTRFLLLLFFSHYIHSAGFGDHTLLLTKDGHTTFDEVNLNTCIQSHKNTSQPVLFFSKQTVANIVHITIADETIICHKKQLFWCTNKNDWVNAKDLLPSDVLQTVDGLQIPIDEINIIERQTELYSLTVGPPHYLYIGKNGILAHNMTWFVGIGLELALEYGAIEFIKATFTVVAGAIALHFAKNKHKKKPKTSFTLEPACKSPQIDPDDDNHNEDKKNDLVYERSDAHRKNPSGKKSREPHNGQEALNNSFAVGDKTMQRVSVHHGEIVIFQHTRNNIYHGYVVSWNDLNSAANKISESIKNILLKNKLVKGNGKII